MTPARPPHRRARFAALAAACLLLLGASGCAVKDSPGNAVRGKQLFVAKCGSCHTLARAGSTGKVGPNLDAAFYQDRRDGYHEDTFRGVTREWIAHPNVNGVMPAKLYQGRDALDVATYVSLVAGAGGKDTGDLANATLGGGPKGIFVGQGCGGCHKLADAGTSGTTGPDLDKVLKGKNAAYIMQSIVSPNAVIASGYPAGVMPQNFGKALSKAQLTQLVAYLSKVTK